MRVAWSVCQCSTRMSVHAYGTACLLVRCVCLHVHVGACVLESVIRGCACLCHCTCVCMWLHHIQASVSAMHVCMSCQCGTWRHLGVMSVHLYGVCRHVRCLQAFASICPCLCGCDMIVLAPCTRVCMCVLGTVWHACRTAVYFCQCPCGGAAVAMALLCAHICSTRVSLPSYLRHPGTCLPWAGMHRHV